MAFHQQRPAPQPVQRVFTAADRRDSDNVPNRPSRQQLGNSSVLLTSAVAATATTPESDDPQTWVLFSPAASTSHASLPNPGRSPASHQGRFRRAPVPRAPGIYGDTGDGGDDVDVDVDYDESYHDDDNDGRHDHVREAIVDYQDDDDDAELDSLDGHLPEFRTASHHAQTYQSAASYPALVANSSHRQQHHQHQQYQNQQQHQQHRQMMPSHDGLGSFRFNQPATSAQVQEQLYAHERSNKRLRRRRESQERVERALRGAETDVLSHDAEKMQRIEAWRLEQSRILLEEIQKLTRQRRQSQASARMRQSFHKTCTIAAGALEERVARLSERVPAEESIDWHDEAATAMHHNHRRRPTSTDARVDQADDGFWTRMTKKVIGDIMGIDDRLLSILFGETLPQHDDVLAAAATSRPAGLATGASETDSSWHLDVLDRVARELGTLVNHLSHHPGAFSVYPRTQTQTHHAPPPHPRANLAAIPEFSTPPPPSQIPPSPALESSSPYLPAFQPTRPQPSPPPLRAHASMQDLAAAQSSRSTAAGNLAATTTAFTQDEWEQELDIKLVFRYLRSRFSSSQLSASFSQQAHHAAAPASTSAAPYLVSGAASSAQDLAAAKSARMRQHHPLVGRAVNHGRVHKPVPTTTAAAAVPGVVTAAAAAVTSSSGGMMNVEGGAARVPKASSCASLSTRRSARTRKSSGSSRHYWDLGGSIGTGSVIASAGPMGSWGEV